MPGHILDAKCACGFERKLRPGVSTVQDFQGYVMAYSANGRDLLTVKTQNAESESLVTVKDPYLEAELNRPWLENPSHGPWGPYRCPSCGKQSLQLWHTGYWD